MPTRKQPGNATGTSARAPALLASMSNPMVDDSPLTGAGAGLSLEEAAVRFAKKKATEEASKKKAEEELAARRVRTR